MAMQIETSSTALVVEGAPSVGTQLGNSAADLVGFFGAVPVAQQTSAANVHTVTAGSTTTVFVNTSFDGSNGSTAYTVGDVVLALKNLGILKI